MRGAKVVETEAAAGGGSLPGLTIPSVGVAVQMADVERALALLRRRRVVALAREGSVVADLRSVDPADDATLAAALAALSPASDRDAGAGTVDPAPDPNPRDGGA
ncbi:MAG: hypothetical protein M5T61_05470 [Acidimicrobiia bacterium]|nr:hypothetical protein [Acidimicrobiia bacterium]